MPNKMSEPSRRQFVKSASLGSLSLFAMPKLASSTQPQPISQNIPENLTIVFQGDSITDAGRNRNEQHPNNGGGLGMGYAYQIVAQLLGENPGKNLRCHNRGISGDKVFQLADRWEEDCLKLKPDVLSILVGVNDFWHTLDLGYKGTAAIYEADYRKLLDRTKKALPGVKLILAEPYAIQGGSTINDRWHPTFNGYREAAKKIAADYGVAFVPLQSVFDEAVKAAPASYWSPEGVHPSIAGAFLIKEAWLKTFRSLMG